jgi:hypothetical protein
MSRKHFIEAAKIVKSIEDRQVANTVAGAYVELFRQFAPNFDRDRFYAACGLEY